MLILRTIIVFFSLFLILLLAALKNNAQDDANPIGSTPMNNINGNSETEISLFDVPEVSLTPEPTDLIAVTYTPSMTDTPFPTEIVPSEVGPTNSPSEVAPSITPSTVEFVGTQPIELIETSTFTGTDVTIVEITETMQATGVLLACELDMDTDGTVTDSDLAQLGRALLNSAVNEVTSIYDLNANNQIDIGDLQKMTTYLFDICTQ